MESSIVVAVLDVCVMTELELWVTSVAVCPVLLEVISVEVAEVI